MSRRRSQDEGRRQGTKAGARDKAGEDAGAEHPAAKDPCAQWLRAPHVTRGGASGRAATKASASGAAPRCRRTLPNPAPAANQGGGEKSGGCKHQ